VLVTFFGARCLGLSLATIFEAFTPNLLPSSVTTNGLVVTTVKEIEKFHCQNESVKKLIVTFSILYEFFIR
jgi:hypothetical protein